MFNLVVLATRNQNKVKEFKGLLSEFPIEIRCLADFGPLPEVIENGQTFDDNAYKKAFHTARILGIPAIADDSGIVVEALEGKPGVRSARFAGEHATDTENCAKLLQEMKGVKNRKASFVCVLSIAVPGGPALTYEASCDGVILDSPRGNNGFGYDPIFYYEPLKKTFAELPIEEKNQVSHRGKVLAEVKEEFDKILKWLEARMLEELPAQPNHREFEDNDWSK
jgi:XTP/dITP diphosphohydrolase